MNDCTGYACPPEHSVPAHDVIVNVTSHLATTGAGFPWDLTIAGGLFIATAVILGVYNHLKHRDGE